MLGAEIQVCATPDRASEGDWLPLLIHWLSFLHHSRLQIDVIKQTWIAITPREQRLITGDREAARPGHREVTPDAVELTGDETHQRVLTEVVKPHNIIVADIDSGAVIDDREIVLFRDV